MPVSTRNSSDLVLSCKDVALGYGDFTVLSGITLEVHAGQVVAIMGGSGSGKTTLLRAATGQILAQRGEVQAFGQDIATASPRPCRACASAWECCSSRAPSLPT